MHILPIKIMTRPNGFWTEVQGWVGTSEVIALSNQIEGTWRVSRSSCLPSDMTLAGVHIDCILQAFHTARQHGAMDDNTR